MMVAPALYYRATTQARPRDCKLRRTPHASAYAARLMLRLLLLLTLVTAAAASTDVCYETDTVSGVPTLTLTNLTDAVCVRYCADCSLLQGGAHLPSRAAAPMQHPITKERPSLCCFPDDFVDTVASASSAALSVSNRALALPQLFSCLKLASPFLCSVRVSRRRDRRARRRRCRDVGERLELPRQFDSLQLDSLQYSSQCRRPLPWLRRAVNAPVALRLAHCPARQLGECEQRA